MSWNILWFHAKLIAKYWLWIFYLHFFFCKFYHNCQTWCWVVVCVCVCTCVYISVWLVIEREYCILDYLQTSYEFEIVSDDEGQWLETTNGSWWHHFEGGAKLFTKGHKTWVLLSIQSNISNSNIKTVQINYTLRYTYWNTLWTIKV